MPVCHYDNWKHKSVAPSFLPPIQEANPAEAYLLDVADQGEGCL